MKRTIIVAGILGIIVSSIIVVCAYFILHADDGVAGEYPLPVNIDIAYKQVIMRGSLNPTERYVVVSTSGAYYYVTQEKFNDLQVIQKIGDGLYRTPEGEIINCLEIK